MPGAKPGTKPGMPNSNIPHTLQTPPLPPRCPPDLPHMPPSLRFCPTVSLFSTSSKPNNAFVNIVNRNTFMVIRFYFLVTTTSALARYGKKVVLMWVWWLRGVEMGQGKHGCQQDYVRLHKVSLCHARARLARGTPGSRGSSILGSGMARA